MARPLRIEYPGAVYHVAARGNEKGRIFLDDRDRRKFLEILSKETERYGVRLFAYVLMGNHYHLLLETPGANLSDFMHRLQSGYTNFFNVRHDRAGHLFQGRYKAIVVQKESYLLALSRYIHLNPVKAGLAAGPAAWPWSSYSEYMKADKAAPWLDCKEVLTRFGRSPAAARKKYNDWVCAAAGEDVENPLAGVKFQTVLGDDDFAEKIKEAVDNMEIPFAKEVPSVQALRKWTKKDADNAVGIITSHYGLKRDAVVSQRGRNNSPRQAAIYIFNRLSRWSLREVGDYFGISYSAVEKSAARTAARLEKNPAAEKELNLLLSKVQT